jgi:hypothetical protein
MLPANVPKQGEPVAFVDHTLFFAAVAKRCADAERRFDG